MTTSKHCKGGGGSRRDDALMRDMPRPPGDLERDPGIGTSKGAFGRGTDPEAIAGENTAEGDVMNDTNAQDGVDPGQQGRTDR